MRYSTNRWIGLLGVSLLASTLSGCIFVGDFDDIGDAAPQAITYETCFYDSDCFYGDACEELAVPADRFTDYVNAICTVGCFDDLDCARSEFNLLPGACIDHVVLGGPFSSRICVERCEVDADCDVAAGFGCAVVAAERLCVPVR